MRFSAPILLGLLSLATAACAQSPELLCAFPAGGRRGATVSLTLRGHNLQGANAVLVSGHGVRAEVAPHNTDGENLPLRLTIAPDAPLGPYELRVATPKGGSNPTRIWVDTLPEIVAAEPNDGSAQFLTTLPVLINSSIKASADRNAFAFQAEAGDTFVFDLNCWRHRSQMDGILELRDSRGALLKLATAPWESDPRLFYTFSQAGRYTITVHDTQFLGGPQYTYRLSVGKLPVLTDYQPRVGRPGETLLLSGNGVHLNESLRPVTLPADAAPGMTCWVAPPTPNGPTLPIPLCVTGLPTAHVEAGGELPAPPVALDGLIQKPGDALTYRFVARSGQRLRFEVLAQRLGSVMDSNLRILDSGGKELAANDDGGTLLAGAAGGIGKDSRLDWQASTDGTYRVEITDLTGHCGPSDFFRLEIVPVVPDFHLALNTSKTEAAQGGATLMTVVAEREGGFDGEIRLHAEGLPTGVTCSNGAIPAGQQSAEITLAVEPGTALNLCALRLIGTASVGGKTLTRTVVAREQYLPRAIDPGMFTDDNYRQPYRDCLLCPLIVTELAESFTLRADPTTLTLAPGHSAVVTLHARRKPGTEGEIKLTVQGLPKGFQADLKSIAAKSSETAITLTAPQKAAPQTLRLVFVGTLDKQTQVCPLLPVNIPSK
jgi:hypothetical protein